MLSGDTHADRWIANRMHHILPSGIRRVSEMASKLKDPVNLSIGQPHFDVPEPIKAAACAAIAAGHNSYTSTAGLPELRSRIQATLQKKYPHPKRDVFITSGSSGGLLLTVAAVVNPGDEVIFFDPYFVMYPPLVTLVGGTAVMVETYPDFQIDVNKVQAAITPRTKAILVNVPNNPSGVVYRRASLRDLALLARERDILLLSDEVYQAFSYDSPHCSPAEFNEDVMVFDGFSKSYGMTGWRLGFAHGPSRIIQEMIKLQHYSFVCAPSMVQHAGVVAWDFDVSSIIADYRRKRDRLYQGLKDRFDLIQPGGAFYMFPHTPWGTGNEFVDEAIRNNLLIVPGNAFSRRDSHFRLSYAAPDAAIEQGIAILNRLARR
jgi:aspartate aminotransferase/aminotransferase